MAKKIYPRPKRAMGVTAEKLDKIWEVFGPHKPSVDLFAPDPIAECFLPEKPPLPPELPTFCAIIKCGKGVRFQMVVRQRDERAALTAIRNTVSWMQDSGLGYWPVPAPPASNLMEMRLLFDPLEIEIGSVKRVLSGKELREKREADYQAAIAAAKERRNGKRRRSQD